MDKKQAHRLGALVKNPQVWPVLEDYLKTLRANRLERLTVEPSALEFRKLQAQTALLDNLLALPSIVEAAVNEPDYDET